MSWRCRATNVKADGLGLKWGLEAWTDDLATTVTAHTTRAGGVLDLQSGGYLGTTGDGELDDQVAVHIADVLALRNVLRCLDEIDGPRRRSDRLRWAA